MKKLLFGLSAALALTLASGALVLTETHARAATWSDISIASDYSYGEKLEIPARTVKVGETTAEATSVLTYPDGSATLHTDVTLDMAGGYKLSYHAIVDGKAYTETVDFDVYDSIYYTGTESEAVYELHENAGREGLSVRLAQGETLAFSPILDLRNVTKDDVLVDFFVTPDTRGAYDFERLIFTFTDAEDPDTFFRVTARASSDGPEYPMTYFMAAGAGQPLSGWEQNGPHILLHVNNEWGAAIQYSFAGVYGGQRPDFDRYHLSIRYDAAENAVYANNGVGTTFVIDFDNSQYFSKIWSGLTSGCVRLSVGADGYAGATANFVIDELMGVDLSDDRLFDTQAPVITLDPVAGNAPLAKVGMAYPIPAATAADDYSGKCAVHAAVWCNYSTGEPLSVPVKDGAFTPKKAGTYTIVYRASDRAGNVTEKAVPVEAKEELPALELEIADAVQEGSLGREYPVAEATAAGGSGNVKIVCRAVLGDFSEELGETFLPRKAGTYTIEYTATDYIGQQVRKSYPFAAVAGTVPVFDENIVLPRYFISGSHYLPPEVHAYDWAAGEDLIASLTVTDAAGSRAVSAGTEFVPTVMKSGDIVRLTFSVNGAELVREVPAVVAFEASGGRYRLNMKNYLIGSGVTFDVGEETTTVSATEASGSWMFAKELLLEGFSAELRLIPARSRFSAVTLTLTDSADPAISASASFLYEGGKAYAKINDKTIQVAANLLSDPSGRVLDVSWRGGAFTVGGMSADYKADGFRGFTSRYAYLTLSFEGAASGSAYELRSICEQPITSASSDRIKPRIAVEGNYGGTIGIGEEVVVRRAFAGDVLDPEVSFSVSVYGPDGSYAVSSDGIRLENVSPDREYTFSAAGYGQYRIVYTAADTFGGKEQEFIYAVNVEDCEAPAIRPDGALPASVKLGEYIVLPEFAVSDNVSQGEDLYVRKYIVTSGGSIVQIPEGSNAFKPIYTGVYRICIYARDAAGNTTLAEYSVTVTE